MSAGKTREENCKVCKLGKDVVKAVDKQLSIGIAASEIAENILGHKLTQRDVFNHRQHSSPNATAIKSEKQIKDGLPPEVQSLMSRRSSTPPKLTGLTVLKERREALLETVLGVTEDLLVLFDESKSIRVARVILEASLAANSIMKEIPDEDSKDVHLTISFPCFYQSFIDEGILDEKYSTANAYLKKGDMEYQVDRQIAISTALHGDGSDTPDYREELRRKFREGKLDYL